MIGDGRQDMQDELSCLSCPFRGMHILSFSFAKNKLMTGAR
jgi:hypothetical protein